MINDVSRRGFVAAGMGIAAVAAASGIVRPAKADEVAFDQTFDVVVVGAGGAGLSAAIEAHEQGLSVIVLESEENVFPSTRLSGGYITLCETAEVPGSADELFADMVDSSYNDCQEDLVRAYVDNAGEMYTKLISWGVEFAQTLQLAHMHHPWAHWAVNGDNVVSPMLEVLAGYGIEPVTATRAIRLVQDADRRVVGVIAEGPEGQTALGATKGVVLATGDFTRNPDLIHNFGVQGSVNMIPVSGLGSRGDGHIMGMFAGADTSYMCAGVAPTVPVGVTSHRLVNTFFTAPSIVISMEGRRFHDESDNYVALSKASLALADPVTFQVYDQVGRSYLEAIGESGGGEGLPMEPEYVADTVEELAALVAADYPDFDAEGMIDEVARYNGFVESGVDEDFGRAHINGLSGDLSPISTPPFYAIACQTGTDHFTCGLKIDPGCHVIDMFGDQIPGLFAAGLVAGGLSSWNYMSGSCVGRALIQGMIAARSVAVA